MGRRDYRKGTGFRLHILPMLEQFIQGAQHFVRVRKAFFGRNGRCPGKEMVPGCIQIRIEAAGFLIIPVMRWVFRQAAGEHAIEHDAQRVEIGTGAGRIGRLLLFRGRVEG